jgi:hypothetical protein
VIQQVALQGKEAARRAGAVIETRTITTGRIDLDPPGLSLAVADVFSWRRV